jgi:hypothetical protein
MKDTTTPVNLGAIGVHYVEGELTPEACPRSTMQCSQGALRRPPREAKLTIVAGRCRTRPGSPRRWCGPVDAWNAAAHLCD